MKPRSVRARRGMTTVDYVATAGMAVLLAALLLRVAAWFGWGAYHLVSSLAGLTML